MLPPRRQTRTDRALEALRERILRGYYQEGEALRQDAIGAELGVSRVPVREALRQLEVEGLVVVNAHRGAVVASLALEQIGELFELRAAIEGDLVRRAVPLLTAKDHDKLDEALHACEVALSQGQLFLWRSLNWRFHSTLYAAARREFTVNVVTRLYRQCDRYFPIQIGLTHGETGVRDEHRAIAAAAREGNGEEASRLMHDHILGAGRAIVACLRTNQVAGTAGSR